jgi:predicted TIM-barrel fold metal-dependent hydrolase
MTVVFDAWINLPYAPGEVTPDPSVVARFGRANSAYEGGDTMADVVAEMDRLGIAGGVLCKYPRDITPPFVPGVRGDDESFHKACAQLRAVLDEFPGRFHASVGIDPKLGYQAAEHVRIAYEEYGISAVRIVGMFTGIPINDPLAYPLYTRACDLGMIVTINVGMPGPRKPASLQRTIDVDDVALCFPDLKIVMSHLGDPWVSETVALLQKHPNVYLMTAGFAPKYVPESVRSFMKRGRTKVMWASDYPILSIERTITEGRALDVHPDALPGYLGANALAVFGEPDGFKALEEIS